MTRILIISISDNGSTEAMAEAMAEALAEGVRSTGSEAIRRSADDTDNVDQQMIECDGLVLGSPVHMGAPDWRLKRFIDTKTSKHWKSNDLVGKVGGVFCSGSGYGGAGGGCELTMLSMLSDLAELGLVLVTLPKNTPGYARSGLQWGPYGRAHAEDMSPKGLQPEDLETSHQHGVHIARVAERLAGAQVPMFSH